MQEKTDYTQVIDFSSPPPTQLGHATPTFFIYVDGELTSTLAGKEKDGLGDAVLATLKPEHRGRDWVAADDSDDDEDDE
eukprot:gene23648-9178_t